MHDFMNIMHICDIYLYNYIIFPAQFQPLSWKFLLLFSSFLLLIISANSVLAVRSGGKLCLPQIWGKRYAAKLSFAADFVCPKSLNYRKKICTQNQRVNKVHPSVCPIKSGQRERWPQNQQNKRPTIQQSVDKAVEMLGE